MLHHILKNQTRYDRVDIRRLNSVGVLNQLRKNGSLSRAEIAEKQGLTRATVSNIVADLIEADLVKETHYKEGFAGRPGLLLELNANCGCMIGVEMNLHRITVVLSNMGQDFIWRSERFLEHEIKQDDYIKEAELLVQRALAQAEKKTLKCRGLCVAWAGLVNYEKGILAHGPLFGWNNVPLKAMWEEKFNIPIHLINEAHAGAVGAYLFGNQEKVRNIIYLSVGVGMAAGIYVDGQLLLGESGFAGQIAHVPFVENGHVCGCGKRGCWITEVGAKAIIRKLCDAGVDFTERNRLRIDWINEATSLIESKDERMLKVLQDVGTKLGQGIARLVHVFNPELIIIGGDLRELIAHMQDSIKISIDNQILEHMSEGFAIEISESEDDQLMGCIATIYYAVMENPPIREAAHQKA
ncbi:MAG: ROK family transcriptional regulator [Verrucomicrobiota bacterium]